MNAGEGFRLFEEAKEELEEICMNAIIDKLKNQGTYEKHKEAGDFKIIKETIKSCVHSSMVHFVSSLASEN